MVDKGKKTKEPEIKVESISEPSAEEKSEASEEIITIKTGANTPLKDNDFPKNEDTEVSNLKTTQKPSSEEMNIDAKSDIKPSPSVSSFSLIDSDKNVDSKEETTSNEKVDESEKDKVKSSADEVNKWIENYNETEAPPQPKKERSLFKIFLIVLLLLSLLAAIAGGVIYYQKSISSQNLQENKDEPKPVVEEEPSPTPTATETTSDETDYSGYTVSILNGSGVPGEAGVAEELLTDLEFDSISTGNADNYDYEDTEINIKEDVADEVFENLKKELESTFTVASDPGELDEDSDYDIEIIVGVRK